MKRWSTTPVSKHKNVAKKITLISAALLLAIATPLQMSQNVQADEYEERINAIQKEIDRYQAQAGDLGRQADTYQNEVNRLSAETAALQKQIDLKQAEYNRLVEKIGENERRIVKNQDVLGKTIADLYVDDRVTAIEMLASSASIGDYVDKQSYRMAVRDRLSDTITEIKQLKKQLEKQKKDIERVLADQEAQKSVLKSKVSEQSQLVSQFRSNQAAYQVLSASRQSQKEQVQRQQQEAIQAAMRRAAGGGNNYSPAVPGDPGKGGYPAMYANADYYSYMPDKWGMFARQCVSYVAWKVEQKNGYMPYWGGKGNANQWPGNARAAGITTSTTPRAGSAGVIMAGDYGHIVWVEKVNSDGTINISQYNYWNAGGSGWGHYSEMYNVSPHTYDVYIYF